MNSVLTTTKTPLVLSGKEASHALLRDLHMRIEQLKTATPELRPPQLVVIQAGNDPASNAYIRQKKIAAEGAGMTFTHVHLVAGVSKFRIIEEIEKQNADEKVDGLIVQFPLDAPGLNEKTVETEILSHLKPEKDADGLTTQNQGALFTGESKVDHWTSPLPATPLGVMRLLEHYNIDLRSKNVVVIGRSRLVGMPLSVMLTQAGATVTVAHRKTQNMEVFTHAADVIVVAAGSKHLLTPHFISSKNGQGPVLIDVGMHRQEGIPSLTGDVHPDCHPLSAAYSPVPGGVGPMTVACLLENTLRLFIRKHHATLKSS